MILSGHCIDSVIRNANNPLPLFLYRCLADTGHCYGVVQEDVLQKDFDERYTSD